jgi:hypothetical protein
MDEPKLDAVFGGHRTGKRKRGTSVLRKQPRDTVRVIPFDIHDADGICIAWDIHTVIQRVAPRIRDTTPAPVMHDRPLTLAEATRRAFRDV